MNQTIAYSDYAVPAEYQTHRTESLLQKISDRIGRALRFSRRDFDKNRPPLTFVEAHLLDDVMGPEISRTLRV